MRLSDVLSKEPDLEFKQVDGFLKKKLPYGEQKRLDVGVVCRTFYCKNCESELTFSTGDKAKIWRQGQDCMCWRYKSISKY